VSFRLGFVHHQVLPRQALLPIARSTLDRERGRLVC
jgi:hypothetical protein